MKQAKRIRKKFLHKLALVAGCALLLWLAHGFVGNKLLVPIARNNIEQLTGTEVEIGSISYKLNGQAVMKDLVIASRIDETGEEPFLTAGKVEAVFSLGSILRFSPQLKSIIVEDFEVDLCYDSDLSAWNMAFFDFGKSEPDEIFPRIRLANGKASLCRSFSGKREDLFSITLEKGMIAPSGNADTCGFFFQTCSSESGEPQTFGGKWQRGEKGKIIINSESFPTGDVPILGNVWQMRELKLDIDYDRDTVAINDLQWMMAEDCSVAISGEIADYMHEANYNVRVHLRNMRVSDGARKNTLVYGEGLGNKIHAVLNKFLETYTPLGVGDFDGHASGKFSELIKSKWGGTVTCKDVSIQYEKFPYLLEHMTGKVELSEKGIILDRLQCRHGDVELEINGDSTFQAEGIGYAINITSPNMLLGNDVYKSLPKAQQSLWYTFAPRGRSKIDYKSKRPAGGEKETLLVIDLLEINADYLHFPYNLKNLKGRVTIAPDKIELLGLVSKQQDRTITLNGQITETRSERPKFNILINAKNIPIDSRLKSALPFSQRDFYNSFEMAARTDVEIQVFPNEVGKRPVEYIAKVKIKDASLLYEHFPLPLEDVSVDAVLTPDGTFLKELKGKNGDGEVVINGTVWPANEKNPKPGYCIELNAKNINIENDWLESLPSGAFNVLSELRPRGAIDVAANLNVAPRTQCPDFKIVMDSLGGSLDFTMFPFPLNNVRGRVTVVKDLITLENMTAVNTVTQAMGGAVTEKIELNGKIFSENNKVRKGEFSLGAKDIVLNKRLGMAFEKMGLDFYEKVSPSGRVDLNFEKLNFYNDPNKGQWLDFSSELSFKNCGVGSSKIVSGIDGKLTATGLYRIGTGLYRGEGAFKADKIKIKDRIINNLQTGIAYDPETGGVSCKEFTAKCYGGMIIGDLEINRQANKKMGYEFESMFENINLQGLISADKKKATDEGYMKGFASGSFGLSGIFGDESSKIGRLNFAVSDMEFAKRSLLGKVMTASQLGNPTDYIFSDLITESYLRKNTLFFDKIELSGSSMQMKGVGDINLIDGGINIDFTAYGRKSSKPSFLETISRGLGPAFAKVQVRGTFDDPETKKSIPVLRNPFEILGVKE